jgi:hypothetical protein
MACDLDRLDTDLLDPRLMSRESGCLTRRHA